ncbi:MAG: hypothetical protein AAB551_04030 [Patescibacteria group bacterium]
MRKFFASISFFLFVLLSVPLVFLFTFSRTYFSVDFYRGPFLDRTYHQIVESVSDQIVQQASTSGLSLDSQKIRDSAFRNFPKDVFRKIIDQTSTQISSVNRQNPDLRVDLSSFREPFKSFAVDIDPSLALRSGDFFPQFFILSFRENIDQVEFLRNVYSGVPFFTFGLLFLLAFFTFFLYPKPQSSRFSFISKMFITSGLLVSACAGFLLSIPYFLSYQNFSTDLDPASFVHFKAFSSIFISLFAFPFLYFGAVISFFGIIVYFYSRKTQQF